MLKQKQKRVISVREPDRLSVCTLACLILNRTYTRRSCVRDGPLNVDMDGYVGAIDDDGVDRRSSRSNVDDDDDDESADERRQQREKWKTNYLFTLVQWRQCEPEHSQQRRNAHYSFEYTYIFIQNFHSFCIARIGTEWPSDMQSLSSSTPSSSCRCPCFDFIIIMLDGTQRARRARYIFS